MYCSFRPSASFLFYELDDVHNFDGESPIQGWQSILFRWYEFLQIKLQGGLAVLSINDDKIFHKDKDCRRALG